MYPLIRRYLRRVDVVYLLLCAACSAISVVVLLSIGQTQLGSNNKASVQLIASLLGLMLAVVFSTADYHALARAWPLHGVVARGLVLPTLFLQPAVRTLAQCLLMMTLFLSIAGSAQLAARFLTSSCQKPKKWVPYALIGLLTLTQLFDISRLWRVLTAFTAWSLVPGVLLLLVLTIARLCRREKA